MLRPKNDEKTNPKINIDIDIIRIDNEAPQWDIPLSISLWCKWTLSATKGDWPLYILIKEALSVSAKG